MMATRVFLERNGCAVTWDEDDLEAYLLEVAQSQHAVEDVAGWLRDYVTCG
jgi:prophage maintenance system killer protein